MKVVTSRPPVNPSPSKKLLTRPEAAEYLGVKTNTLEVWASTQRYGLSYIKVGRSVRYRMADLDAFIDARTVTPGESH